MIDAGALDEQVEVRALASLRTGICDGVVVATSSHSRRGPARTPCWSLSRAAPRPRWCWIAAPSPAIPAIDIDTRRGSYLATKHLLGLGHRRIAHFSFATRRWTRTDPDTPSARYRGYLKALAEAGIEADPTWLFQGGRAIEGGRAMAHALLERFPDRDPATTAVAAVNDRTAIGVLRGCYDSGIRVPGRHRARRLPRHRDGALHDAGAHNNRAPAMELGEMAAESLFTLSRGGEVEVRDRTVPVSLTIRESCGAQAPSITPTAAVTSASAAPTVVVGGSHA